MATTKWARYRFVVKEGPDIEKTWEPRDGVIDMIRTPTTFIMAEECGKKPIAEYPLKRPDFLSFGLRKGTSMVEAQRISDFLNDHLEQVAITRFGDAEDAAIDVRLSDLVRQIDSDRFTSVLAMLDNKLKANDVAGAVEAMRAVESVFVDVISEWAKAIKMSREILAKLGSSEDLDA